MSYSDQEILQKICRVETLLLQLTKKVDALASGEAASEEE